MIPREILKKIRQIELRTNRIVTETLAGIHSGHPEADNRIWEAPNWLKLTIGHLLKLNYWNSMPCNRLAEAGAGRADDAAGRADDAASLANDAATCADGRASRANDRAGLANTVATRANDTATFADDRDRHADDAASLAGNRDNRADDAATFAVSAASCRNSQILISQP